MKNYGCPRCGEVGYFEKGYKWEFKLGNKTLSKPCHAMKCLKCEQPWVDEDQIDEIVHRLKICLEVTMKYYKKT